VLTNKYSEGYAGRRYYEGQRFVDPIETLAVDRARALFTIDHALDAIAPEVGDLLSAYPVPGWAP
jgi:glycine/serine hydroxymethyltransferase